MKSLIKILSLLVFVWLMCGCAGINTAAAGSSGSGVSGYIGYGFGTSF
ncbi:MAG: hypothetical protein ACK5LP_10535 [Campylobacteraceae bacterium]